MDEEERRRRAIDLLKRGLRVQEVCAELGRTRQWLAKWVRRREAEGAAGLRGRSRAHRSYPRVTPPRIVRAVLAARERLARRARGRRFAGIGADAVAWELELAHIRPLPSRRTIERILASHGKTAHPAPARRVSAGPYPAPRAERAGDVQETDLVGPRHLRTPRGPSRFFSFHTVDVAGGGAAAAQFPDKSGESFCRYLTERAWARLGLPKIWQVDNEAALAGYPSRDGRIFTQPVRLALLLGVEVRFIPEGEPGRNADIESFNALWQARVLRRFDCPGLGRLRQVSDRFEGWFMEARPHPKLSVAAHGTRFPGRLLASLDGQLPQLPAGFSLDAFRDAKGELHLPLARGRVSWVRRVDEHGRVRLLGRDLRLGKRAANQYVVATLATARQEVRVRLDTELVSRFAFPIREHVVQPLRLPQRQNAGWKR